MSGFLASDRAHHRRRIRHTVMLKISVAGATGALLFLAGCSAPPTATNEAVYYPPVATPPIWSPPPGT